MFGELEIYLHLNQIALERIADALDRIADSMSGQQPLSQAAAARQPDMPTVTTATTATTATTTTEASPQGQVDPAKRSRRNKFSDATFPQTAGATPDQIRKIHHRLAIKDPATDAAYAVWKKESGYMDVTFMRADEAAAMIEASTVGEDMPAAQASEVKTPPQEVKAEEAAALEAPEAPAEKKLTQGDVRVALIEVTKAFNTEEACNLIAMFLPEGAQRMLKDVKPKDYQALIDAANAKLLPAEQPWDAEEAAA